MAIERNSRGGIKKYGKNKPRPSGSSTSSSSPKETVQQTVDRAKALLGSAYNPNTKAPTAQRLDEIASQSFIKPEVKKAYEASKGSAVNQNYMAASYNATLPKTTIPDSAASIQSPYQQFVTPTPSIGTGNISFASGGVAGLGSLNESQQNFHQQQLDRELAKQEETKSSFQQLMSNLTSPGEARKKAQEETGIDVQQHFAQQEAGLKEIETLTNEYNKIVAAKDQQIAATNDKMASMNFINNQTAQIERNAAPQLNRLSADINAKAAVLQAMQGNFAEAQKYVNQAVSDATAENKFQYDMFSMAYDLNRDAFDRVESIYSQAYTEQMALAEMAYNEQRAEKETIGNLLLQYPNAGIDIYNDDLPTALKKAGLVSTTAGGTGSGFSISSRTQQVIDGFTPMSSLTPTEAQKVRDDLFALGYGSDTPPEWFVTALNESNNQTLMPSVTQEEWDKHKEEILSGSSESNGGGLSYDGF